MIFVSSRGCIQIHTGEVRKLLPMGPWFNVMDPNFNLHLREDHVASAWVVKKPTTDGVVNQPGVVSMLMASRLRSFSENGNPAFPNSPNGRKQLPN